MDGKNYLMGIFALVAAKGHEYTSSFSALDTRVSWKSIVGLSVTTLTKATLILYQLRSWYRNEYMKRLYRLCLCLLVLLSSSCLKDFFIPRPDPKIFSCKINGEPFLSRAALLTAQANATIDGPGPPYRMHIYTGSDEIDITIKGAADGTGVYEFSNYFATAVYTNNATGKSYRADSLGHGNVTLQNFHPAAGYITGTFWFNAVNIGNPTDSVKVTDGHFYITALNKRY